MAKINWTDTALTATIAVGGGFLLNTYVGTMDFVANLIGKLPADLAGIDTAVLVFGIVALGLYNYFKK